MFIEGTQGEIININQVVRFSISQVPYQDDSHLMGVMAFTLEWEIGHIDNGCGNNDSVSVFEGTQAECNEHLKKIKDALCAHSLILKV